MSIEQLDDVHAHIDAAQARKERGVVGLVEREVIHREAAIKHPEAQVIHRKVATNELTVVALDISLDNRAEIGDDDGYGNDQERNHAKQRAPCCTPRPSKRRALRPSLCLLLSTTLIFNPLHNKQSYLFYFCHFIVKLRNGRIRKPGR